MIAFSEMYHRAIEALAARSLVLGTSVPVRSTFSEMTEFSGLLELVSLREKTICVSADDAAPTEQECRDAVKNLLVMTLTPNMKAQGLQGLSQMAAGPCVAKAAVTQQAWDTLVECTGCEDEDVHRCAITAVADLLSREPASSAVLSKPNLAAALTNIESRLQSLVPEVARQSKRSLDNLANARRTL